jgi:hypothetical protein
LAVRLREPLLGGIRLQLEVQYFVDDRFWLWKFQPKISEGKSSRASKQLLEKDRWKNWYSIRTVNSNCIFSSRVGVLNLLTSLFPYHLSAASSWWNKCTQEIISIILFASTREKIKFKLHTVLQSWFKLWS